MGFSSGLAFLVLSSADIWMAESGFSKSIIGLFSLAHVPYVFKFLFAPFIERIRPLSFLSHKKGWILLSHAIIFLGLALIASCEPSKEAGLLFVSILLVKFGNSAQNIVSYSFQIDRTKPEKLSTNAAFFTFGFRVGLFLCSYGLLMLAHYISWSAAFVMLGVISMISSIIFFVRPEPRISIEKAHFHQKLSSLTKGYSFISSTLLCYLVLPIKLFAKKEPDWKLILLLIATIKTGDTLCHKMAPLMYLEIGFSKAEIANLVKCFGLIATILGGFTIYKSKGKGEILKALELSLFMHSLTTVLYIVAHHAGHSSAVLAATIFIENFTGGMMMSAVLTFLYYYSNAAPYPAVMYTVFFGFYSLNNVFIASLSGLMADAFGWDIYFTLALFISMTIASMVSVLRKRMN